MRRKSIMRFGAAALLATALAGCGGGGGDSGGAAGTSAGGAGATGSGASGTGVSAAVSSFLALVQSVVGGGSETSDPVAVDDSAAPVSETGTPASL